MSVWSFWGFEAYTIMASYLGVNDVAGQVILRSLGLLTFMIPLGIMFGSGIIIGNSLGEGRPKVAMQYYKFSMLYALIVASIQISLLYFYKESILTAFTD